MTCIVSVFFFSEGGHRGGSNFSRGNQNFRGGAPNFLLLPNFLKTFPPAAGFKSTENIGGGGGGGIGGMTPNPPPPRKKKTLCIVRSCIHKILKRKTIIHSASIRECFFFWGGVQNLQKTLF